MTSPNGAGIEKSIFDTNPFIGIVTALLFPYEILLCSFVDIDPMLSFSE